MLQNCNLGKKWSLMRVPSFIVVFVTISDNPWRDEGGLLPDQAEALPCSQSYCLLPSTCHHAPRLGPNTLQAGVWMGITDVN